jgi:Fic family protein
MKRWIWEQEAYPDFTYDVKALEPLVQAILLEQGYLSAITQTMDRNTIAQRQLEALMYEAISTAAIEGEILNRDSVKASIQRKLGIVALDGSKRDVSTDYLIEILIDANTNYDQELTLERLFGWHNALFPNGYSGLTKINVATLRGEETMEVVGGAIGKEKTYYVAPPRVYLEGEMDRYVRWFNDTPASLVKACIAHLWFVILHPFDDGNGRIARAITDLVLSKIEQSTTSRLYSMSGAINNDRVGYYKALEKTTGFVRKERDHLNITQWCEWFLSTLSTALGETKKKLGYIVQKTVFWDTYQEYHLNARQIKVLNKILDIGAENFQGSLSKKKYMRIADCASTTASRDMTHLLNIGCIGHIEGTNGRNVRYEIVFGGKKSS